MVVVMMVVVVAEAEAEAEGGATGGIRSYKAGAAHHRFSSPETTIATCIVGCIVCVLASLAFGLK